MSSVTASIGRQHPDYFNRVATDYERFSNWTARPALVAVETRIIDSRLTPGAIVADVGAGDCTFIDTLISKTKVPGVKAVALDRNPVILMRYETSPKVARMIGDITCLPFPNRSLDLIVGRQVLHYTAPVDSAKEIARAMSPGGAFLSTQQVDYSQIPREWYQAWSDLRGNRHRRRMTEEDLVAALNGAGLCCIQNQDVPVRLEYSWETLAFKYNTSIDGVRDFFLSTPRATTQTFGMQLSETALSYTSRFKVSLWGASP